MKIKAHFETVQTKGNRFWKWKRVLKLSQVKETYFENESAFWNCPNYPLLLARCFILVVSLQNYFQKYHTCGDPSKLFSKTVTCGDLSNSSSFSFQFLSPMVTFAILLVQKILWWWPSINQKFLSPVVTFRIIFKDQRPVVTFQIGIVEFSSPVVTFAILSFRNFQPVVSLENPDLGSGPLFRVVDLGVHYQHCEKNIPDYGWVRT